MSPTLTTFLFELANFLLLAALVGWLLFRPVRAALAARRAAEQQRTAALEERDQAVAKKETELDSRWSAFEDDVASARQQRLTAAETEASEIVARARASADRDRDRNRRMLAHLEQAEIERLSVAVAAAGREAVARLLADIESTALDEALVGAACRRLEADRHPAGAVLVESTEPLAAKQRDALARAGGRDPASVEFRVVPDLGGGLRVTLPNGLIDASAAGIAAHAERELTRALAAAGEPDG